ncbi:MAG: hypothetical protein ACPG7F_02165 [Aggregatilineales bacterium]
MSEKQKPARERLILRSGGMMVFAPIVIGFMVLLAVLTFVVGVVLLFGTPETGVPADVVPAGFAVWTLMLVTLLALIYATFRYLRGIGQLAQQRHYVKQEEKRIERLELSQTGISDGMTDEELALYAEDEVVTEIYGKRD